MSPSEPPSPAMSSASPPTSSFPSSLIRGAVWRYRPRVGSQCSHDCPCSPTAVTACEEGVLSRNRLRPDYRPHNVGVDLDATIGEEAFGRCASRYGVAVASTSEAMKSHEADANALSVIYALNISNYNFHNYRDVFGAAVGRTQCLYRS